MDSLDALTAWRSLLGDTAVLGPELAQQRWGDDTGGLSRRLAGAIRALHKDQLPAVMRIATQHQVCIHPISTGRNWGYGTALPPVDDCVVLDLSGLDRILHFDPVLGVVTVEPGVTQGKLSDFLRLHGHDFLVPVTGAGPSCSLVGNALERGYGITPVSDHFAAVTDLKAILADGSLYQGALGELAGPAMGRLSRWGIGPYTAGLFSQGNLGVVSEMSIALARRPACVMTCLFSLSSDRLLEQAVERVQRALSTLPGVLGGVNLMNRHRVLAMTAPYPREEVRTKNGCMPDDLVEALGRDYQIQPWTGFATLYGTRRVVSAAQRELRQVLKPVASRVVFVTPERARALQRLAGWVPGEIGKRLAKTAKTLASALSLVNGHPNETALPLAYWRNASAMPDRPLDPARDGCGLLWFAPLVPMCGADVRRYVSVVSEIANRHGVEPLITLTSVGDRLFDSTVPILFDRNLPNEVTRATACRDEMMASAISQGLAPYRVAADSWRRIAPDMPVSTDFNRRIKEALDPLNIISPGRYQASP